MSTIEELLKDYDKYPGSQWAQAAITDPWTMALRAMKTARNNLRAMIQESQGVAGYHLNGALATWDYFTEDDWLGLEALSHAIEAMGDLTPGGNVLESEE